ncbi:RNA-directed DNA polymerase, eukaryota, reverse transcriptase zinc-binding domain protein [Tanacetum coccineum]
MVSSGLEKDGVGGFKVVLCLQGVSVIVNGSPTKEFQFYKGLKQGDPLSSFLFILVTESLHVSFQKVVDAGLCINMNKSKLMGISVDGDIVEQAALKIECVTLKSPFSYLVSKVGGLMSRIHSWDETVDCMIARLSKWKMKTLSVGGSLTLIKAVLGSMPIYHMSLFKVNMKVLQRMESIRCHFFNGTDIGDKKPIWVKWKNALASKEKGAIHGEDGKIGKKVKATYPSIWLDIVHELEVIKKQRLYALETIKDVTVASKLSYSSLDYSFRRAPRGGVEESQFLSMLAKVEGVALVNMKDRWVWSLEGSGDFSVTLVRKLIDDKTLPKVSSKSRWSKAVPIKVNILAWKVKLDCLPTRINISRRGMDIDSILWSICDNAVESTRPPKIRISFRENIC